MGRLNFGSGASGDFATHVLAISPDNKKLYTVNSHRSGSPKYYIIEFDLATKTNRNILCLNDVDPKVTWTQIMYHSGDQIWDRSNYFYFSNFNWKSGNVRVTRFNPWLYESKEPPVSIGPAVSGITKPVTGSGRAVAITVLPGEMRDETGSPASSVTGRKMDRHAAPGRIPAAVIVRPEP